MADQVLSSIWKKLFMSLPDIHRDLEDTKEQLPVQRWPIKRTALNQAHLVPNDLRSVVAMSAYTQMTALYLLGKLHTPSTSDPETTRVSPLRNMHTVRECRPTLKEDAERTNTTMELI
jgi:hypothetical protein